MIQWFIWGFCLSSPSSSSPAECWHKSITITPFPAYIAEQPFIMFWPLLQDFYLSLNEGQKEKTHKWKMPFTCWFFHIRGIFCKTETAVKAWCDVDNYTLIHRPWIFRWSTAVICEPHCSPRKWKPKFLWEHVSKFRWLRVIYCHLSQSVLTWHLAHWTCLMAQAVVLGKGQADGGVNGFQILWRKSGWVS